MILGPFSFVDPNACGGRRSPCLCVIAAIYRFLRRSEVPVQATSLPRRGAGRFAKILC
jgi:hypothetical protein